MRFATYNILYDSTPDNITVRESLEGLASIDPLQEPKYLSLNKGQPWSARRQRIAQHLLREDVVLAGFQEALIRQVHDLAELMGDEWAWLGVGRDNGKEGGEFCPIFYKKAVLSLVAHDTFWLSETPFKPSKFRDAGCYRICEVAHFSAHVDGNSPSRRFTLLNTHLDNVSDEQRKVGASLILARARFEAVKHKTPVFVTGDFNSPSTGADSESGAYKIITGEIPPSPINDTFAKKFAVKADEEPNFKMLDLRAEAPPRSVSTNFATFTGISIPTDTSVWGRIDFIFGGKNRGWDVVGYNVASALADDGMLESDHRLVFADINLA